MASFTQKSCTPSHLLPIELEQSSDEGKDISYFKKEVEYIASISDKKWIEREKYATELFLKLQITPHIENYPYFEPSTYTDIVAPIKKENNFNISSIKKNEDDLLDKLHGGILGKCIGCLLGKPVEGWDQKKIISFMKETHNFPIKKYLFDNIDKYYYQKYKLPYSWSLPIIGMPEDDDINYLLIACKIIKEFGVDFTPFQVAETWTHSLPILRLCTAERIAYRNFVNGIYPPESALFCNPYREWIGAQIRADFFGYISPGNPDLAMKLAWKDASISHTKNGIYGAIWVAVILTLVPVRESFDIILNESLNFIPKKSRFYRDISTVIYWYKNNLSIMHALSKVHELYSEKKIHHWCHVLPNAMIVAIALLWSKKDFQYALHLALIAGFDTDSNGATVGSIMGYSIGARNIPFYWKDILKNRIYSSISDKSMTEIDKLAEEALALQSTLLSG